jgi:hypothetical protein
VFCRLLKYEAFYLFISLNDYDAIKSINNNISSFI